MRFGARDEKKKKRTAGVEKRLEFFRDGREVFSCGLLDLPLKESVILEHSILFFDDPAPCYIHRGAVCVRLLAEIEEELGSGPQRKLTPKLAMWVNLQDPEELTVLVREE